MNKNNLGKNEQKWHAIVISQLTQKLPLNTHLHPYLRGSALVEGARYYQHSSLEVTTRTVLPQPVTVLPQPQQASSFSTLLLHLHPGTSSCSICIHHPSSTQWQMNMLRQISLLTSSTQCRPRSILYSAAMWQLEEEMKNNSHGSRIPDLLNYNIYTFCKLGRNHL